jgi:hypothetical protein
MSVPTPLDNDKETHGVLPGLWACFSRKFGDYRFSEMPLPALVLQYMLYTTVIMTNLNVIVLTYDPALLFCI